MNAHSANTHTNKIMQLIKIKRTLTIVGECTIEVPDGVELDAIESALEDEANLFELLESRGGLSTFDMDRDPNDHSADSYEAQVVAEKCKNHVELTDVIDALNEDEFEIPN